MKHAIAVLLLSVALVSLAHAQKNGATPGTVTSEQTLLKLENKWVDALVKADTAVLDSLLADTYVDTDEGGHRSDKQAVLSILKSGDLKMNSIKLSDMKAYIYGDAAVVTGNAAQSGSFKGQPLAASILFTDTFIRKGGSWKPVASHRTAAQ